MLGRITRMDKQTLTPRSHKAMIREYPITGMVEGWYFRQREVSAGCYIVEGSDVYGRTISRRTTADPDAVLAECVAFARQAVHSRGGHNAA
jgi:hypothetical protein